MRLIMAKKGPFRHAFLYRIEKRLRRRQKLYSKLSTIFTRRVNLSLFFFNDYYIINLFSRQPDKVNECVAC